MVPASFQIVVVTDAGGASGEGLSEMIRRGAADRVEQSEDEPVGAKDVTGVAATDWGGARRGEAEAERFVR